MNERYTTVELGKLRVLLAEAIVAGASDKEACAHAAARLPGRTQDSISNKVQRLYGTLLPVKLAAALGVRSPKRVPAKTSTSETIEVQRRALRAVYETLTSCGVPKAVFDNGGLAAGVQELYDRRDDAPILEINKTLFSAGVEHGGDTAAGVQMLAGRLDLATAGAKVLEEANANMRGALVKAGYSQAANHPRPEQLIAVMDNTSLAVAGEIEKVRTEKAVLYDRARILEQALGAVLPSAQVLTIVLHESENDTANACAIALDTAAGDANRFLRDLPDA